MRREFLRFVFVCVGIVSIGIMAPGTQAGPVVRFTLDYSVPDGSSSINYFDVQLSDTAPITVANFLQYVNSGLYNNTIIHRDAEDFVMQGGGFTPTIVNGNVTALAPITSYGTIQNEYSPARSNLRGTIAMAKVGSDPNSATSQWFVNLGDNSANLDAQNGGFTVFGQVIGNGMTLIDAVNNLPRYDLTSNFGSAFNEVPLTNNGSAFVSITTAAVVAQPTPVPTGKLSGSVYVDVNKNGVMDGQDYAIADAQVSLMQAGSATPVATVYTGSDGFYHFNGVGAGTFSVQMQTPSSLPGQNNGTGHVILDKNGNVLSVGTAGTAVQNAYNNVALGDGQAGLNFNFAESAYPVALISTRMLLNTSTGVLHAGGVAKLGTNLDSASLVSFGAVLVGTTSNKTLTVTNLGSDGSALSGSLPGATDVFGPTGALAFGPLGSGQTASQTYTFAPTVRKASAQEITVTSQAGDVKATLFGTGVAPVQSVVTTAANAGSVRIGTTGTASLTVKNTGDGNLSGAGSASNLNGTVAASSDKFTGSGGAIGLADGATQTYSYTYAPTAHASDSTAISVQFSNGNANGSNLAQTVSSTLSGTGVGPTYSSDLAAGAALDFGTVPQASLKSLILSISNSSTDSNGGNTALTDLTLLNAQISGLDAGLFSIVGFTAGTVLHKGDPLSLEIAYNGTGAHGDRSAMLTIFTDEGAALGGSGNVFNYDIKASLAPEPGSLALLAMGGLFLGGAAWRRRVASRG